MNPIQCIAISLAAASLLSGCKAYATSSNGEFSELQISLLLLTCTLLLGALLANHKRRKAVAETQRTVALLKDQEQHYRGLVESMNAISWEMALPELRFSYVSQHAERMLGHQVAAWLLPGFLDDNLHPHDREPVLQALREHALRGEDLQLDFRLLNQAAQPIWVRSLVNCVSARGEPAPSLRGLIIDINEQKRTQESLKLSEQKFSRAFQVSPDALVLTRQRDGLILDVNEGFSRVTGYRREEVLGRTTVGLGMWLNPDDRSNMLQQMREGPVRDMRTAVVTAQGSVRQTEISTETMTVEGEVCLLAIVRDVTQRLAMESSLRQAASVFENTTEGVIITDARTNILAVNQAFTRITGFEPGEVLGQLLSILNKQTDDEELVRIINKALIEEGHWQGETWSRRKNGDQYACWINISKAFNTDGSLNHLVAVFSDITPLKQSQASLDHQAHHDPLTDLPNRLLFEVRLRDALAQHNSDELDVRGALLFIDLDRFKQINDSLGHHVGDVLLKAVSKRIHSVLRACDTVARHGGDEFIVLAPSLHTRDCAAEIANQLLAVFRKPFLVESHEFFVSASIGISLFPYDGHDPQSLIKHADAAMYRAKKQGRNRFEYYTRDLTADAHQRMLMENDIRRGLDRREFTLHYQPKLNLVTGKLFGVEALVRWHHPKLGVINPSYFIPLAEETGLIVELGNQILHEALDQLATWLSQDLDPVLLAVNVSGTQLIGRKLVDEIASAIAHYGIPPDKLELEITEDFIMNRDGNSVLLLHELRNMGISLSIDDFGTGYSSLNYLKELPLNTLKIDRSFVAGLPAGRQDTAISQTIIVLAHNLGMTVVAEGVETQGQKDLLQEQGCDAIQGFLVSPALTADVFANQFLRNSA